MKKLEQLYTPYRITIICNLIYYQEKYFGRIITALP